MTNGGATTNGCGSICIFARSTATIPPSPRACSCVWENWRRKAKRPHSGPRHTARWNITPCSCRRRCNHCETTTLARRPRRKTEQMVSRHGSWRASSVHLPGWRHTGLSSSGLMAREIRRTQRGRRWKRSCKTKSCCAIIRPRRSKRMRDGCGSSGVSWPMPIRRR